MTHANSLQFAGITNSLLLLHRRDVVAFLLILRGIVFAKSLKVLHLFAHAQVINAKHDGAIFAFLAQVWWYGKYCGSFTIFTDSIISCYQKE